MYFRFDRFRICVSVFYFVLSIRFDQIIWCIMSNSSVIDGDLYSSMSESEEEHVENSFFEGGESSSSIHDAQYFDDIIREHVYKSDVPVQLIPIKGLILKSLKLTIKMYSEYAEIGGFDVRLSTQSRFDNKIIKKKHVICNRGGKQKKKSCDTLGTSGVRRKRNSNSRAIGCQAKIIFESVYRTPYYKVFQFDERHNHPLEKRSNLKKARQMSYSEKEFIVRVSTSKIGPTMGHKLRASLRGGYQFVKTKVVDYKNLRRDINRVIGYKDAQMIVNTMNDRRAHYPNYSFEFNCQDDVLFGLYRMVFVPFTAIDHHKKSVIVGSGLLVNESIESYSWFLKAFFKTHGKEPTLVLTYQDAAIKQAVENISDDLFTNIDFRKRFSKLVWDINMKPDVFEVKWGLLMNEFNLEDTRWFKDMFTIRDSWIPRYFSDIPMCGLMKTTSRSESMNSFFNTYSESGNLLLNFMMNYDTAIQKQRNTQRELDKASKKASYKMQTPREIELCKKKYIKHVFSVRTHMLVLKMVGKFTLCSTTTIKVEMKAEEKEINCSCEHFKCMSVLCRHAFTIMMRCGVKEIPKRYFLKRWRKDVISRNYRFSSVQSDSSDCENVKLVNDSYYSFESCLDIVRDDKKRLTLFAEKQQMLLKEFEIDYISPGLKSKTDGEVVCKLLGVTIPILEEINIHVPEVQSNKGSGIKKRIPSTGEVAYENSKKEHRMCSGCGKRVPHNLRTCPERVGAAKSAKDNKNNKQ
uniref:SWIM-type domain-containing protein n=1 Tax=Lactuca sativa TaxID=4236 RepID=A0A9R1UWH9_LACSA|nr:hypothetical protein LSAT_V11C800421060 [Lactuca sativa]